jgi:two-component system NarL family sensor kinase
MADTVSAWVAGITVVLLVVGCVAALLLGRNRARPADAPPADLAPALAEVAAAREEEREVLSYDLHDGLSQYVLAAQMHLDTFVALRSEKVERAEQELDHARLRLREAAREVHRIISMLSLRVSSEISLSEAVRQYVGQLCETQAWQCEVDDQLNGRRFASAVEAMVFRVVQEALANSAKHAQTDRIEVSLTENAGLLVATVRDWGIGFVPEEMQWNTRSVGLRSMCSRARLLGGSCSIESSPGMGASVTIRVPCAPEGSDDHAL